MSYPCIKTLFEVILISYRVYFFVCLLTISMFFFREMSKQVLCSLKILFVFLLRACILFIYAFVSIYYNSLKSESFKGRIILDFETVKSAEEKKYYFRYYS